MFQRVLNWMIGPDPVTCARNRRDAAWSVYQDAKRRNDSRDRHWAEQRLKDATTALVRAELGR